MSITSGIKTMDNRFATMLRTNANAAFPQNMSHQKIEDTAEGAHMANAMAAYSIGEKIGIASSPRSEGIRNVVKTAKKTILWLFTAGASLLGSMVKETKNIINARITVV